MAANKMDRLRMSLRAAGRKLTHRRQLRRAVRRPRVGWWSDTMDRWAAEEHYSGSSWR